MNGISGISGMAAGGMPQRMNMAGGTGEAQAAPVQQNLAGVEAASSKSIASLSTTSVNASSESLIASNGPVLADDKALGLALLLLTLEYLKSGEDEDEEKKGLLDLMLAISQQQGGGDSTSLMYSSRSLSIESTQMQVASTENATSAYSAGAANPQQVSSAGPGAAGLDVSA